MTGHDTRSGYIFRARGEMWKPLTTISSNGRAIAVESDLLALSARLAEGKQATVRAKPNIHGDLRWASSGSRPGSAPTFHIKCDNCRVNRSKSHGLHSG
jgi:hypothetical protein